MNKHAEIKVGEYVIPLIGISPEAALYECDLCHDQFSIEDVQLNEAGNQFLCRKCQSVKNERTKVLE
jgi:hypothetical protein